MDIRLSWVGSGAPEYSAPTPFAFEMVRVDASRRVTSSAETDTTFSLEYAFLVGTMGFGLVFGLAAISKCLEFKDERVLEARHASQDQSRDRTLTTWPHGTTNKLKYKNSKHVHPPLPLQASSHQSSLKAHRA